MFNVVVGLALGCDSRQAEHFLIFLFFIIFLRRDVGELS